ncbi:Phage shock protein B [Bernardetia litoralis DSM 6794]|uniref:Phage shock protein B n=1 Tax=Bernardetia litoralis (strain ATCC 23117 / DSM 6794 / NBRC 15988 / NCIMB 1366 / Fx l1 / Sio-4) TaxID=880071 RepID=I4AKD5_BERLS|nr:phage shock protein B [Bernardetia litoralis]AFM04420.1 Phage shock protein B [Bernardetia litoralis DSM 6794]
MLELFIIFGSTFGVATTAIVTNYFYKVKKLEVARRLSQQEQQQLDMIIQENQELRQRLENVEVIVSSADLDILTAGASMEDITRIKNTVSQVRDEKRFKLR